jgi:hypothetical protein
VSCERTCGCSVICECVRHNLSYACGRRVTAAARQVSVSHVSAVPGASRRAWPRRCTRLRGVRLAQGRPPGLRARCGYGCRARASVGAASDWRALQARPSVRPVVMMRKARALMHAGAAQRQELGLTARSSGTSQSLHGGWASSVGLRAAGAAHRCVCGLVGRAWCAHSAWRRRRLGRERWVSVGHASDVPDGLDRAWLRRHTHMDRIGLARSGESVVAGCAGGGWCACEARGVGG